MRGELGREVREFSAIVSIFPVNFFFRRDKIWQ